MDGASSELYGPARARTHGAAGPGGDGRVGPLRARVGSSATVAGLPLARCRPAGRASRLDGELLGPVPAAVARRGVRWNGTDGFAGQELIACCFPGLHY